MTAAHELTTGRLVLRTVSIADAVEIEALVSDRDIAATTMAIPHPYPRGGAIEFIEQHLKKAAAGQAELFVVRRREDDVLVGAVGLSIDVAHERAELGYWMGKPFWARGYCTEAAKAIVEHAFRQIGLNRVFAHHMTINPASGRVLQNVGMKHEATLRGFIEKWGERQDVAVYGLTRSDYDVLRTLNG
jgi:RimJ/RimL family protein N-acetyltransferase